MEKFTMEVSVMDVLVARELLDDMRFEYTQPAANCFVFSSYEDYLDALDVLEKPGLTVY